ncbi:RNA recognition motif domain-containing protein [Campylobacter gastrosuis]|uniref:RNA-binding protein n=1 Tax=Campylobacter gastrosuis TaxID=2974576 RepID=A0ABT7HNG7_9BACT|nr:RNA-binding protein [Campylobacter gastrosuis]MDL0088455.1 RNA-binding protein [Campylobacter gastrosuis]
MNIYVGNLSYRMTESELREAFAPFGEVKRAKIVKDRETNRSKGFGFVEIDDDVAANKAIEALNNKEVGGRVLRVNESRPKE